MRWTRCNLCIAAVINPNTNTNGRNNRPCVFVSISASADGVAKHAQALDMQAEFATCKSAPGGCSEEAANAITSKYTQLSDDNIAQVQSCITRGDVQCIGDATQDAALHTEVAVPGVGGITAVFERRADRVRDGAVSNGSASDVQIAKRVADVRHQICGGQGVSACDITISQLKGEAQTKALKLFGAVLVGTPMVSVLLAAAPALALAAQLTLDACVASPVLCANRAGIAAADLMVGDALGGAGVAGSAAFIERKVSSLLQQRQEAAKAAERVFKGQPSSDLSAKIEKRATHDLSVEGEALLTSNPVGSALKSDMAHRSASYMREVAATNGTNFIITGGDGVTRTLTQLLGELNGIAGRYEYIVDSHKNLTHQMFVRGGVINGIPIKP